MNGASTSSRVPDTVPVRPMCSRPASQFGRYVLSGASRPLPLPWDHLLRSMRKYGRIVGGFFANENLHTPSTRRRSSNWVSVTVPCPLFLQPLPYVSNLLVGKSVWTAVMLLYQFEQFGNILLSLLRPMTNPIENGLNITIHVAKYSMR